MALSMLWIANAGTQAAGHDLPAGFRSLADVTLNRDSSATIRAKLGPTRERQVGTGHGAYVTWCYAPASAPPGALLELMSDASEMGTPGRALNVIRLRVDAPSAEREGCASLRTSVKLTTPAGLRLGISRANIEALLGKPRRQVGDSLTYYFDAKEYLGSDSPAFAAWNTPERRESCFDAGLPYANVGATVIVVLRDDHAVEVRVERYDQSIC